MNCPVCKKEAMIVLEWDQVELDHCTQCRGIWLDAGELELLLEAKNKKDNLLNSFEPCSSGTLKRRCPICSRKMEKVSCHETEIDRCTEGHGFWFDLGELDQVLRFFGSEKKISDWLRELFHEARLTGGTKKQ